MYLRISLLAIFSIISVNKAEKKTLNIMGLFSVTGDDWPGGGACLTAAEMALRHVNERQDLLRNFNLNLTWRDGQCHAGTAVNMMFDMLYSKPTKHMVLGPGCSIELEVTAQATPAWNLTHISYGGASPVLSDRKRFPRLFRLSAPDNRFNLARIALAKFFNWRKVATLNVAQDYFSAVTDNLVQEVKGSGIEIISEEIFDHDPLRRIQNLKRKDARIIMTASYEPHGKRMLCAAYQAGLYGPKIVWMFPGWYKDEWWKDPNAQVSCTDEQMAMVAEGSIMTGFFYKNIRIEKGLANLTVPEFQELYYQEQSYRPELEQYEFLCPMCYDSVWAIGLALNCTHNELREIGHPKPLEDFEYSDRDIGDIMTSCASNVSFIGVSGHVEFELSGEPMKNIKIEQIQGGKKVLVGVYWTEVEEWYIEWYNGGLVWQADGVPPRDSTLISEVEVLISPNLYITMSCLAAMGIILAFSLFVFNIFYRGNVYVKLSSPNINNVLLLGCIISYSSVFMESLERQNVHLCKLRTFTVTIGFTMAFGALFSKTWRVYKIFANKKLLRLRIKDSQLIGIVIGLLVILCFVLLMWEALDPVFFITRYLDKEDKSKVMFDDEERYQSDVHGERSWRVYLTGNDAEMRPYIRVCTSHYFGYFSWTIYIIEGILLSFGAFLSFETRKVKIAALNDSRLIGICLYNVVVLCAVGLTLNLVLHDQVSLLYGIISAIIIIATTSTQLVVFIPKVMTVYCPHRVEIDRDILDSSKIESTSFTIQSRKFIPRGPCDPSLTLRPPAIDSSNENI